MSSRISIQSLCAIIVASLFITSGAHAQTQTPATNSNAVSTQGFTYYAPADYYYDGGGPRANVVTWTPGLTGQYQLVIRWGVNPNHTTAAVYAFDADGAGAGAPVNQATIDETNFAPGTTPVTPPANSGPFTLGTYNLTAASTFTITNSIGNEYLTSGNWVFTAVPEPTSLSLLGLGGLLLARRRRRA